MRVLRLSRKFVPTSAVASGRMPKYDILASTERLHFTTITDEIVNSMGQMILRGILKDIKSAQWFSIIADEATDI